MATCTSSATPFKEAQQTDEIISSLPSEVFRLSSRKAVSTLILSLGFTIIGYAFLTQTPWFLTPIGWILAGTAATGLFVIGHDCGKGAFFKSDWVNQLVGTMCFLPLLLPFESFKVNYTLTKTVPTWVKDRKTVLKTMFNPFRWFSGTGHYFDMQYFPGPANLRVRLSVMYVYAFAAVFFPLMVKLLGVWGLVKYWVGPWIILRCWQYTFRESRVEFAKKDKDTDGPVDLTIVYHRFPRFLELVWNNFNLQFSQYLGHAGPKQSIPSYNLSLVHNALSEKYDIQDDFVQAPIPKEAKALSPSAIRLRRRNLNKEETAAAAAVESPKPVRAKTGGKVRLTAEEFDALPLYKRIDWLHVYILTLVPVMSIYGMYTWDFNWKTVILTVVWYYATGMGITGGYHRLYAHKAYKASLPVKLFLLFCGTGAVEGSVRWWSRDHRAHHRYTDTDKDPYDATKGFWWSHMGWMLMKKNPGHFGYADISDLNADPWVMFQHKYYLYLAPTISIGVPAAIGALWGDWYGGIFIAGFLRLWFVQQATFCINSVAHSLGDLTFADDHTPRDSIITALITMGEGYHNFHHEFPHDYRNGIRFYHYDPTKWIIATLAFFGFTYDLQRFPENEIQKGKVQMLEKQVIERKKTISWGVPPTDLPTMSFEEVTRLVQVEDRKLIVVNGLVHDVAEFAEHHPGGEKLILSYIGKDATDAFTGGVYAHSNAGKNLLTSLRVASLHED